MLDKANYTPRLQDEYKTKFRSNKEIYCQLIDDVSGKTLMQSSSRDKSITDLKLETNMDVSFNVGKILAEKAVKKVLKK
jgi:large subunit ribosomal protein L18